MGLAACLMSPPSSYAQSAEAASSAQPDSNQQLLQRINDLEAKVKQLEQKQSVPPAPIAVAPAPEAPAPVEMPTVNEVAPRL